ncbi:MAG: hypothetical protein RLZZ608_356 [Actinomycetota bacterium]|jgi:hypothetical protein
MLRKVTAPTIVVAICAILAGCTAVSPIEISVDRGSLALVSCDGDSMRDLEIYQLEADGDVDEDWGILGYKTAPLRLSPQIPIVLDSESGFENAEVQLTLEPGTLYSIEFTNSSGRFENATFKVPESGFVDGVWLRTDGATSDKPCARY